ncbi:MAG TPA: transporter substrate-binding domain-containing protein [Gaiellaceae bacterium]|nr:transporter substrate-binding domain-containing protein [Gaiellaceae bacterium]
MRALATLAALLALAGAAAAGAAPRPAPLVVALDLSGRPFQAGSVRGGDAVFATGFEVEVARALARRLGYRAVRFVVVPREQMLRAGGKRWDLALARLVPGSSRGVRFSATYLPADQAVVLRRGLRPPAGRGALRRLQLCAERGTRAAGVIAARIRPSLRTLLLADEDVLARRVQTGLCDAALVDAARLAAFTAGRRGRLGAVAGRVETGVGYTVALARGSGLVARVDAALRRLQADGTLARLRRGSLGADPLRLPVLR